ncbi:helix-turn-helix domain-containing protein [Mycobacterium sp. E2989]|uniref:helix-turn-helix domain-containing protein n=1 Tax=Mycobacterium sp. E2989 TaxID=1834140 RepID=UPI0009ED73AA|nr:helix-turn-helix domain-containing protein [Mycobacterium sp. E2989]
MRPTGSSWENAVQTTQGGALRTRRDAADALNINVRHLDSLIAEGEIPAVRLGKSVRIPQWVIDRLVQPTPTPDSVADYIEQVLAVAPPLSDEQRARLAELLRPARNGGGQA